MPDLVDLVLDRLSPTSLDLLDRLEVVTCPTSRHFSDHLQKSLNEIEEVYLKRCITEINGKTELFISKTRRNKLHLDRYTSQFENLQCTNDNTNNVQKIKAYSQQIDNLRKQLQEVMKKSFELGPDEIFIQINDMSSSIEELEMKCTELKDKLKVYNDFPPNMREAQYCISDAKERIKKKESILESNIYGKN